MSPLQYQKQLRLVAARANAHRGARCRQRGVRSRESVQPRAQTFPQPRTSGRLCVVLDLFAFPFANDFRTGLEHAEQRLIGLKEWALAADRCISPTTRGG
jgi:hypothetical protein